MDASNSSSLRSVLRSRRSGQLDIHAVHDSAATLEAIGFLAPRVAASIVTPTTRGCPQGDGGAMMPYASARAMVSDSYSRQPS